MHPYIPAPVTLAVTLDHSNSAGMLSVQAVESRNSAPGSHSTMTPAGTLTWVTTLYREGEPKEPEPGMTICAWALKAACRIGPTSVFPLASRPVTVNAPESAGKA